jgi:RimJ/RimL family protein N-acetyltransferase
MSADNVSIDRARAEDVDGLLDALAEVADEDRWISLEPGFDRAKLRQRFLGSVADDLQAVFVVRAGGRVVGSLGVYRHPEFDYVLGMSLVREWRGRGIGAKMLAVAERWGRERGLQELSLLVFPHNRRAIKLYERGGFVRAAVFEKDVTRKSGEIFDVILMTKDLRTPAKEIDR